MGGTQDPTAPQPAPTTPTSPTPATQPAGPSTLDNLVASMGMPQLLIVGAALVLLALDVVLGWLARQYYAGDEEWLGSVIVVLGFALSRWAPRMLPFAYQTMLLVGALIIAIIGVRGLVLEILSLLSAPNAWDAVELLGLVLYAGGVIAVIVGLWMLLAGKR